MLLLDKLSYGHYECFAVLNNCSINDFVNLIIILMSNVNVVQQVAAWG